jgi:hypothetical protein
MLPRAALLVSLMLALWTLARPALAMPAGLCDDRGASAIAPAPALEAPDVAIRRARVPTSCEGAELPVRATIAPAHRVLTQTWASPEQALPVGAVWLGAPERARVELVLRGNRPCRGIDSRVERPPRD